MLLFLKNNNQNSKKKIFEQIINKDYNKLSEKRIFVSFPKIYTFYVFCCVIM